MSDSYFHSRGLGGFAFNSFTVEPRRIEGNTVVLVVRIWGNEYEGGVTITSQFKREVIIYSPEIIGAFELVKKNKPLRARLIGEVNAIARTNLRKLRRR